MTPIATGEREATCRDKRTKNTSMATLRLPPEVRKKLNAAAQLAGMSFNQWASLILAASGAGQLGGEHAKFLGEFAAGIPGRARFRIVFEKLDGLDSES